MTQTASAPRAAILTIWFVVNAVNLLQAAGFLTRAVDPSVNRRLGIVIMTLSIPAGWALWRFIQEGSGLRFYIGPAVFLAFVALELLVDYLFVVEFRDPMVYVILVPYLVLFFGAVLTMGIQTYKVDMRLWGITAVTSVALLVSMGIAMKQGTA